MSERFARDNFGSSQAAVGQVTRVEGEPLEIVGVLGAAFDFPSGTQVWIALPMVPESKLGAGFGITVDSGARSGIGAGVERDADDPNDGAAG